MSTRLMEMSISNEKMIRIKEYVKKNYVSESDDFLEIKKQSNIICSKPYSIYDDFDALRDRIDRNLGDTWQQSLFDIIDQKFLDKVEVYKRALVTKQTFYKISHDAEYQPDKDTAIRLCIGLKLNIDETLGLLSKAGFTLSKSLERDLVIRFFIENNEYDIFEIDAALEDLKLQPFIKD